VIYFRIGDNPTVMMRSIDARAAHVLRGEAVQVKRWKTLVLTVVAISISISGYFSSAFVLRFQVFGPPVWKNEYKWLGPTPRSSSCVSDIGKVNYWECDDVSVFREHRIGCVLGCGSMAWGRKLLKIAAWLIRENSFRALAYGCITAFYEKVENVKADVAAVLV
jgi:hypothetical protein